MAKQESLGIGWGFWLWWVSASTVGWFSGFIVGSVGGYAVMEILPSYALVAWGGVVLGAGVGIFQWLVLRRRVSRAGWWVLARTVGLAGGAVVGTTAVALAGGDPTTWGVVGGWVVGGAMAGLMQWFVLRRQVSRAGWWVLASTVGWAVSSYGVVLGAVTGIAVVWLLRQPIPEA
ncbi:MAG: hypothetical protein MUP04_09355 [Anaerolineae bacterium]|nr:hypothetical protein [Anaerolineae bacterium]